MWVIRRAESCIFSGKMLSAFPRALAGNKATATPLRSVALLYNGFFKNDDVSSAMNFDDNILSILKFILCHALFFVFFFPVVFLPVVFLKNNVL
jgi:hypothetical protein